MTLMEAFWQNYPINIFDPFILFYYHFFKKINKNKKKKNKKNFRKKSPSGHKKIFKADILINWCRVSWALDWPITCYILDTVVKLKRHVELFIKSNLAPFTLPWEGLKGYKCSKSIAKLTLLGWRFS